VPSSQQLFAVFQLGFPFLAESAAEAAGHDHADEADQPAPKTKARCLCRISHLRHTWRGATSLAPLGPGLSLRPDSQIVAIFFRYRSLKGFRIQVSTKHYVEPPFYLFHVSLILIGIRRWSGSSQ